MMGPELQLEPKLFYHNISLEDRVGPDHPLRKINELVDFHFVRSRVADLYGVRGNASVDPAVILKLMFLLFYENVKSERQLMAQLPLRLDWLWFCGYDLDDPTPNHSVISKARRRWGRQVFSEFFQNILQQCIDSGLVDGETIHIDSSMINANAGKDKLGPELQLIGERLYHQLDQQSPSEPTDSAHGDQDDENTNQPRRKPPRPLLQKVSRVDPDARLGKKYSQSTLGYKDHRVVDDRCGIITTTITTAANKNDNTVLQAAVESHEVNTSSTVRMAVADKIYGTIENYKYLHEKGCRPCIPHQKHGSIRTGKFSHDRFIYDRQNDGYICPAGHTLSLYDHRGPHGNGRRYRAKRDVCEPCEFFSRCVTSAMHGRQVCRNVDAEYIEWADTCLSRSERKRLQARRRSKAEGSFADGANNHGFKRARWRGLEKMQIQNTLIAAVQNLRKLLRWTGGNRSVAATVGVIRTRYAAFVRDFRAKCHHSGLVYRVWPTWKPVFTF